jgi:hypothetical protein
MCYHSIITDMIKFMFYARIALVPVYEIRRKPNCMCGVINTNQVPSKASVLAHVLLLVLLS